MDISLLQKIHVAKKKADTTYSNVGLFYQNILSVHVAGLKNQPKGGTGIMFATPRIVHPPGGAHTNVKQGRGGGGGGVGGRGAGGTTMIGLRTCTPLQHMTN